MPAAITSKIEFKVKVKEANRDQLLVFHSENSSMERINRYNIIALETAVEKSKLIEVYTINLDMVTLDTEDAKAYQYENQVICCTTINKGVVRDKQINPSETKLRQMILDILV